MTDTQKLKDIISMSGLKYKFLAESLSLTPYGLMNKIENRTEFKASEILTLCNILGITSLKDKEKLFFTDWVD